MLVSILVDNVGDLSETMHPLRHQHPEYDSYIFISENNSELIQIDTSTNKNEISLTCHCLTTNMAEFFNYTSKPVKLFFGKDQRKQYKLLPQQAQMVFKKELALPSNIPQTYRRRPAYWMRGKPVTEEQAFEIIRRTDNFFNFYAAQTNCIVPVYTFDSWWFDNHFPEYYGWCRPDGRIGLDSITQRWPTQKSFILDGATLLKEFPFLDMIFLLWDSEEEMAFSPSELENEGMPPLHYDVYIHNQTVEILPPHQAWQVFCQYQLLYGDDLITYTSEYNQATGQKWVDTEYLKKCLLADGIEEECIEEYVKYSICSPDNIFNFSIHVDWEEYRLRYKGLLRDCETLKRQMQKQKTSPPKE